MKVYYNISIQDQWLECYTNLPDDATVTSLLKDAYQTHQGETFLKHVSHWPALKAYKTIKNVQQRTSMPAYEPLLNDHSSPDKPVFILLPPSVQESPAATSVAPKVEEEKPEFYRAARFPDYKPSTREIPPFAFTSLGDLKDWAHQQMTLVELKHEKKVPSEVRVFLVTQAQPKPVAVTDESVLGRWLQQHIPGKFYFTFEDFAKEKLSVQDLRQKQHNLEFVMFEKHLSELHENLDPLPKGGQIDNTKLMTWVEAVVEQTLANGDLIVIDEIQKVSKLVRYLLRAINTVEAKRSGRLKTRLILSGTPAHYIDADAIHFPPEEFNKIGSALTVEPLDPVELVRVVEHVIGYLPAREIAILWTITGGNPRHLKSVLRFICNTYVVTAKAKGQFNKSRVFREAQYMAIKQWISKKLTTITEELGSDWQIFRNVVRTQSAGFSAKETERLKELQSKNVVSNAYVKINQKELSGKYVVTNEYIRTVARGEMLSSAPPKRMIQDLVGFGFEDLVQQLIRVGVEKFGDEQAEDEPEEENVNGRYVVAGEDLSNFSTVHLAFKEYDIDLVLVSPPLPSDDNQRKVDLVLGTLKFDQKQLNNPKKFFEENIERFLAEKVPKRTIIRRLLVVGIATEKPKDIVLDRFKEQAVEFGKRHPNIKIDVAAWELEDLVKGIREKPHDQTDFPLIKSVEETWPLIPRQRIIEDVNLHLSQCSSLLIRGLPGVGKTVYIRHVINEWIGEESSPPNTFFFDGVQMASGL